MMAQVRLASLEVRLKLKINPLHFLQSPTFTFRVPLSLSAVKLKINPLHFLQSPRACHLCLLRLCWLRTGGDDHSETMIIIQSFIHIMMFIIMTSVTL